MALIVGSPRTGMLSLGSGVPVRDEEAQMALGTARKGRAGRWWRVAATVALGSSALIAPAILHASPSKAAPVPVGHPGSGFLSNFDVTNDTGIACQGFEVQIEDVTQADAPYQYYGTYGHPTLSDMTFPDGHRGIRVVWLAQYAGGSWSASTPAGSMDHFGVYVTIPPGNQNLTWLCDSTGNGVAAPYGGTASGNGYTNNTITNPVPQVQSAIVATPAGEVAKQTIVNQAANPAPGLQQNAVWFYKHPQMSSIADPVLLRDLTPDFPAVAAMGPSQINDVMDLRDAGGTESAAQPMNHGDGGVIWVVDTYAYADPATGQPGPYDDAHTASCNEIPGDPNNCANFVGALMSTTVLEAQPANGGNRSPVNIAETTDGAASDVGGTVVSNDIAANAAANANPGNIDCGQGAAACTSVVDDGTGVDLSAVPAPGFAFAGWQVAGPGAASGVQGRAGTTCTTQTTCHISPSRRVNLTARFVRSFTVNQPAKATELVGGSSAKVTVTGTGFKAGATPSLSGTGVSVSGVSVKTTRAGVSTMKFTATATAGVSTSLRDVTITNPDTTAATCTGCVDVHALPSVVDRSPSSVSHPTSGKATTTVALAGSGFQVGMKAKTTAAGVSASIAAVTSDGSATMSITTTKAASPGEVIITLKNPDKGTTTLAITVT